jgi:hypothetical protein
MSCCKFVMFWAGVFEEQRSSLLDEYCYSFGAQIPGRPPAILARKHLAGLEVVHQHSFGRCIGDLEHCGRNLPTVLADFGRKGAAFAALGEMPIAFFPFDRSGSLTAKKDGVKLGESALNDFFTLLSSALSSKLLPKGPLPVHGRGRSDRLLGIVRERATCTICVSLWVAGRWCCCSDLCLRTCSSRKW